LRFFPARKKGILAADFGLRNRAERGVRAIECPRAASKKSGLPATGFKVWS